MTTLALEHVSFSYRRGRSLEVQLLRDATLTVVQGEFVGLCGARRSGRTTLLRIAAGAVTPDRGTVVVCEDDGTAHQPLTVGRLVDTTSITEPGRRVLDEVALPLTASGASMRRARTTARRLLDGLDVGGLADADGADLSSAEALRVALARTLGQAPTFIFVDEPTLGLDADERDAMLVLLRALSRTHDIGVLATAGDLVELSGVDRALHLADGTLLGRTSPRAGSVVPLPHTREAL